MKILSIDTSTPAGSVALTDGDAIAAQEQQGRGSGTHAERLIASIDHLLAVAGWTRDEIEGIAVGIGPGSFTGLRIGLATAKGMALARGLPVAGASSLASLAQNGRGFDGTVAALIDARRGELYAAAWRVEISGKMKRVLPEFVAPPDEVVKKLRKIRGSLLLVGDGAAACGETLRRALGKRAQVATGTMLLPQAANLAMLTHARLAAGKGDDAAALLPNYIRRSDAEIGFLGKGVSLRGARATKQSPSGRGSPRPPKSGLAMTKKRRP